MSTYEVTQDSILSITKTGIEDVFDIQVDRTENFIANGLVSHNTRWHLDDLSGRLLEQMHKVNGSIQWEVVDFPAIKENNDNDEDPREIGEALWPGKYNLTQLDTIKTSIGTRAWASLYQQNPVELGGNIIKGADFQRYTVLPKIKYRKIFADTAQKTQEVHDYSVFACWGIGTDNNLYLLDLIRGKWEAPELQRRAVEFWAKHAAFEPLNFGSLRELKVEDKASGTGLIQSIRLLNSIPIKGIPRSKDKFTRVSDALPYIEAKRLFLPENQPWVSDFISEHEAFTANDTHPFDDQVDTTIDAIEDMLSTNNKLAQWERLAD